MEELFAQVKKQMDEMFERLQKRRVVITPAFVDIDPRTNTITLEFSNPTEDTLTAEVTAGIAPPLINGNKLTEGASQAGGLVSADTGKKSTVQAAPDTIDAQWSLATWITDLPKSVTLAPGAKTSVTIKVTVPPGAKPGDYSAWIVAHTPLPKAMKTKRVEAAGSVPAVASADIAILNQVPGNAASGSTFAIKDSKGDVVNVKIPAGTKVVYHIMKK